MDLILIAAVARNNVIGNGGKLPWNVPLDMKRFKELTLDHPVLMGRKTYFSIPDRFRPFKGRTNLVLTSDESARAKIALEGALPFYSMQEAIDGASKLGPETYVAGGQKVYEDTINLASRLEITQIDRDYSGDAFFPEIDTKLWQEHVRNRISQDVSFVTYVRRVNQDITLR